MSSSVAKSNPPPTTEEASPNAHPDFTVILAPRPYSPPSPPPITIFLSGIIENVVPDWRTVLTKRLSHLPVTILNPLRKDWDSSWKEETSDPRFVEQVNWELDFLEGADIVAVNFGVGTAAPITLLEFGLVVRANAGGGEGSGGNQSKSKIFVACPRGFLKRGNVEMVCRRLEVPFFEGTDELAGAVEERVNDILEEKKAGRSS